MINGIVFDGGTLGPYYLDVGDPVNYQQSFEGPTQTATVQLGYQTMFGYHVQYSNITGTYSDFCPASGAGTSCYRFVFTWSNSWWNVGQYAIFINVNCIPTST